MKYATCFLAFAMACGSAGNGGMGLTSGATPDAGQPDAPPLSSATLYRFSALELADPHLYIGSGSLCLDVTPFVNNIATNFLNTDTVEPTDGKLDASLAIAFRPLVTSAGSSTAIDIELPVCTAPELTAECTATADTPKYATTVMVQGAGTCLDVLPGTASNPPDLPTAPCFASASTTLKVSFAGTDITLVDARGAATYAGDRLNNGLIRGFLSQTDAEAIQLKTEKYGTYSVASFLYGGGSCHDDGSKGDLDVGPDGQPGWYIYLQFRAEKVPYRE
jgi:hypothetical protein